MIRIGIGYDIHCLKEGRDLFLGGVKIPSSKGLDGHSDADVLLHALADALLGALGENDIGHYFPNTDERWKDVSSIIFLEQIHEILKERKAKIVNVDTTLLAEAPKIFPYLEQMKKLIAEALHIETSQVGIKATTNETLGAIGREEGMAAMAVALIEFS